jgi:hypothetical protein
VPGPLDGTACAPTKSVPTTSTHSATASAANATSNARWSTLAIIALPFHSWEGEEYYRSAFRDHQLAMSLTQASA